MFVIKFDVYLFLKVVDGLFLFWCYFCLNGLLVLKYGGIVVISDVICNWDFVL